jgi:hypothetical protein
MAQALCMLDNSGYRHTLRICNTYYFVRQQWLGERAFTIRLYVHCLSSFPLALSISLYCVRILLIICRYQNFSFPPLCSLGGAVLAIETSKPVIRTLFR